MFCLLLSRLFPLLSIPRNTIIKFYPCAAETVQGTANCKVYFSTAQLLDKFKVVKISPATGIRYRYTAPLCKLLDEFLVDALLETLVVGGVNEEFGAVRL